MSIFNLISLFGGLAMFLFGMRLMSSGLKENSTGTLKKIMEKVTNNLLTSFLLGVVVTALIQSSTATIVITSGLVGAGILTLKSSAGIIVGANVGTTVTGQIIRLMDLNASGTGWLELFKPSTLAPVALIAGIVLIMFMKFDGSDVIGQICMGFGILFMGLMNMTDAVNILNEKGVFNGLFLSLGDNPLIGYLIGFAVSFVLQSSSATVGILQAFSVSGMLFFRSIYSVILGIYLGDSLTTYIVCSIGANPDAKRVGLVHVLFNLSKMVLVFAVVSILHMVGMMDGIWDMTMNSGTIANTNTIFNIACSVVLLPFMKGFISLSKAMVKDDSKPTDKYSEQVQMLDVKFFATPALAFNSCYEVLEMMFSIVSSNIEKAFDLINNYSEEGFAEIAKEEESVDALTDRVSDYLLKLNPHISQDEHIRIMGQYYDVATEIERLGDHAVNISEYAQKLAKNDQFFSEDAMVEFSALRKITSEILGHAHNAFADRSIEAADHIEPLEEVVDDMTAVLKDNHLSRLQNGECNVISGTIFMDMLSDIERISDVCSNIGVATVSRVRPEYSDQMHNYMSQLHQGDNEQFNKEYREAHDRYFSMLNQEND